MKKDLKINDQRPLIVLDFCIICGTGRMQNSRDGVTCGDFVCQMDLPKWINNFKEKTEEETKKELEEEFKEITKDLEETMDECKNGMKSIREILQDFLRNPRKIFLSIETLESEIEISLSKLKSFFKD